MEGACAALAHERSDVCFRGRRALPVSSGAGLATLPEGVVPNWPTTSRRSPLISAHGDQPAGATKCNPASPIARSKRRIAVDGRRAAGAPTRVGRSTARQRVGGTGQVSRRVSPEVLLSLGGRSSRTTCRSLPISQPMRIGRTGRGRQCRRPGLGRLGNGTQPPCTAEPYD